MGSFFTLTILNHSKKNSGKIKIAILFARQSLFPARPDERLIKYGD